ncbi:DUF4956 domain-containing protein [Euzebya rosea]|uniref:DUF4956 domain-containing protein n=1 Tax=Euzebya rosea TaxID=2052804 RepID=UPI000D3E58A3|nr:DUF4956 domain-containing protein [Euzebya rosea]
MSQTALVAADLIAISILVFAMYFPRYRRRDMVVAILGLNVGVMAVATALSTAQVSAGLGLGLFGVLSIIRLRSSELEQEEVAYYFTALALGLLGGIAVTPVWVTPVLMGAIVVALWVGDHPRLFAGSRHQVVTLDAAYTDEAAMVARLESLLGGSVTKLKVKNVDLVRDSTVVDVRYTLDTATPRAWTEDRLDVTVGGRR